jgi:hypothetical protein
MSDTTTSDNTEAEATDTEAQEATEAETDTEETDTDTDAFDAAKAREKIRKVNSEAAALRKRLAEADAKGKDSAEKTERVTALEAENLRLRIGVKHGLPEALVKRLSGTTEEEILQDAEELMELFGGGKKPPTQQPREKLRGGGDPTQGPDESLDVDKFAEQAFRR